MKKFYFIVLLILSMCSNVFASAKVSEKNDVAIERGATSEVSDLQNIEKNSLELIAHGLEYIANAKYEIRNAIGVVDLQKVDTTIIKDNTTARAVAKNIEELKLDTAKINEIARNGTDKQKECLKKALIKANLYEEKGKIYFIDSYAQLEKVVTRSGYVYNSSLMKIIGTFKVVSKLMRHTEKEFTKYYIETVEARDRLGLDFKLLNLDRLYQERYEIK